MQYNLNFLWFFYPASGPEHSLRFEAWDCSAQRDIKGRHRFRRVANWKLIKCGAGWSSLLGTAQCAPPKVSKGRCRFSNRHRPLETPDGPSRPMARAWKTIRPAWIGVDLCSNYYFSICGASEPTPPLKIPWGALPGVAKRTTFPAPHFINNFCYRVFNMFPD